MAVHSSLGTMVKYGSIQKKLGDTWGFLSDGTVTESQAYWRTEIHSGDILGYFRVAQGIIHKRVWVLSLEILTQMVVVVVVWGVGCGVWGVGSC